MNWSLEALTGALSTTSVAPPFITPLSAMPCASFYLRQGCYRFSRCLFVCLSVCLLATLRKNFRTNLHEILSEGLQWANTQMIKFWWRSGSPSGYRDCFPDSSLLEDTETDINRLRCATLQCTACTSRHRHSNYDVITSPAVGRGMHCTSASSSIFVGPW